MLSCSTADLQHPSQCRKELLQDSQNRFGVTRRGRREHPLVNILRALFEGDGQGIVIVVVHVMFIDLKYVATQTPPKFRFNPSQFVDVAFLTNCRMRFSM